MLVTLSFREVSYQVDTDIKNQTGNFMKIHFLGAVTFTAVAMLSSVTFAQIVVAPDYTRADQIQQRIDNQQRGLDNAIRSAKITPMQATNDQKRLNNEQNQLRMHKAEHGGYITPDEQFHLNKELDKGSYNVKVQEINDGTAR